MKFLKITKEAGYRMWFATIQYGIKHPKEDASESFNTHVYTPLADLGE